MPTNTPVAPYLSMKVGGKAGLIIPLEDKLQVENFVRQSKAEGKNFLILGDGTNTLFEDGDHPDVNIGLMRIKGWVIDKDRVQIGAGEDWDKSVERLVNDDLQGTEALSGIPGTAGAGPIQNIGAYGSEIKDILESVEAFDNDEEGWVELNNAECQFTYRDSLFKRNPTRYTITGITLKLNKNGKAAIPKYKDAQKYFGDKSEASLKEIREAIISIRGEKLPNPSVIPNCGSFFKNPFVSVDKASELKLVHPDIPLYPDENKVKVSAGWLIEKAGFKGVTKGGVGTYAKNALVVTGASASSTKEILDFASEITQAIQNEFGITLEREPVLLPPR